MARPPIHDKEGDDGGGGGGVQTGVEEVESVVEEVQVDVIEEHERSDGVEGNEGDAHRAEDASGGEEEEDDEQEENDEQVLGKLKALCSVLGSNYKEKLDEIGIVNGVEITEAIRTRLLEAVFFLRTAKENRFDKMKESASKLRDLWKKSEQPTQRLFKVYQIFYILSADSPDEIHKEKYLSVTLMKKIEKEIESIKSAVKAKYQRKKKKMLELLKELHLTASEVGFDTTQEIDPMDYPKKTEELRGLIKQLKKKRMTRMQLVVRMELIEMGIKEKFSAEKVKVLIENAKEFIRRKHEGANLHYDGLNVLDAINATEKMVNSRQADNSEIDIKSARSLRLATRLKKKDLDSAVNMAQEATADTSDEAS